MMQDERLVTLGQVSADVAHELMVPGGSLSENLAVLRRDLAPVLEYVNKHLARDPDSEVAGILEDLPGLIGDLVASTERLREVTHGLMAQVRGEETAQEAELSEVVSFVVGLSRAEVRDRTRLTSSGGPVRVVFGPVRLRHVLLHLIVNAAQTMGGTGRQGRIDVRWKLQEPHVLLTVSDNGRGIPLEQQESALSRCKEWVTQGGGTLELSSVPGEGTDVTLRLPRAQKP